MSQVVLSSGYYLKDSSKFLSEGPTIQQSLTEYIN